MDQKIVTKNEKRGGLARLSGPVARSILGWLGACDMGMSPREAQLFFNYSGFHVGKTMTDRPLARIKTNEGA